MGYLLEYNVLECFFESADPGQELVVPKGAVVVDSEQLHVGDVDILGDLVFEEELDIEVELFAVSHEPENLHVGDLFGELVGARPDVGELGDKHLLVVFEVEVFAQIKWVLVVRDDRRVHLLVTQGGLREIVVSGGEFPT